MTKILLIVFHLILLNVDLISLKNNSEPAANAIKPNDTSNMKSISLIMVSLIIPTKLGPIITPTTKAKIGHDIDISKEEINRKINSIKNE